MYRKRGAPRSVSDAVRAKQEEMIRQQMEEESNSVKAVEQVAAGGTPAETGGKEKPAKKSCGLRAEPYSGQTYVRDVVGVPASVPAPVADVPTSESAAAPPSNGAAPAVTEATPVAAEDPSEAARRPSVNPSAAEPSYNWKNLVNQKVQKVIGGMIQPQMITYITEETAAGFQTTISVQAQGPNGAVGMDGAGPVAAVGEPSTVRKKAEMSAAQQFFLCWMPEVNPTLKGIPQELVNPQHRYSISSAAGGEVPAPASSSKKRKRNSQARISADESARMKQGKQGTNGAAVGAAPPANGVPLAKSFDLAFVGSVIDEHSDKGPEETPQQAKQVLNETLKTLLGRPFSKGDAVYDTEAVAGGFQTICRIPEIPEYEFCGATQRKKEMAERSAAWYSAKGLFEAFNK